MDLLVGSAQGSGLVPLVNTLASAGHFICCFGAVYLDLQSNQTNGHAYTFFVGQKTSCSVLWRSRYVILSKALASELP